MDLQKSDEISFRSIETTFEPEGMEGVLEILLPQVSMMAEAMGELGQFDPEFGETDATYLGTIVPDDDTGLEAHIEGYLTNLEVFDVESSADDGLVLLREKDEMIIITDDNTEVAQEDEMELILSDIEAEIQNQLL